MDGGSTTIIYDVNLTQVETLLQEQKELLEVSNEQREQLHVDAEILIASLWILAGAVVGVAVGYLLYHLWRS